LLASAPYLLTVNPSLLVQSVADLIALARAEAGKVMFFTSGTGGIPHLAGELLNHMAGIKMVAVPYKGGGPAMLDVMAGQVQANFAAIPGAIVHVKSGRLRAVAVTSAKRFPALPDVPAIAETLPGYEIATWFCVLGPAGTSRALVQKLNRQIVDIISDPLMRDYSLANGFQPLTSTPEKLAAYIESEMTRWAKIVKESGVKPD
jgi:tripartite-type tricarboxylate transporter receptor subunit TctC